MAGAGGSGGINIVKLIMKIFSNNNKSSISNGAADRQCNFQIIDEIQKEMGQRERDQEECGSEREIA